MRISLTGEHPQCILGRLSHERIKPERTLCCADEARGGLGAERSSPLRSPRPAEQLIRRDRALCKRCLSWLRALSIPGPVCAPGARFLISAGLAAASEARGAHRIGPPVSVFRIFSNQAIDFAEGFRSRRHAPRWHSRRRHPAWLTTLMFLKHHYLTWFSSSRAGSSLNPCTPPPPHPPPPSSQAYSPATYSLTAVTSAVFHPTVLGAFAPENSLTGEIVRS